MLNTFLTYSLSPSQKIKEQERKVIQLERKLIEINTKLASIQAKKSQYERNDLLNEKRLKEIQLEFAQKLLIDFKEIEAKQDIKAELIKNA